MESPIITLTTDWGNDPLFVGMMKGRLMSLVDGVRVVDVSHSLRPYDLRDTAFVAQYALVGFPAGTVHIVDVRSVVDSSPVYVAVRARGQYMICADNGIAPQVFGGDIEEAVALPSPRVAELKKGEVPDTLPPLNFAAYTLFAEAAASLAQGARLSDLGEPVAELVRRPLQRFVGDDNKVDIYIQHVDPYGNAYLGMTYDEFVALRRGRRFCFKVRDISVDCITPSYGHNAGDFRPRVTVSATGLLELAVREGYLRRHVGVSVDDLVILNFFD